MKIVITAKGEDLQAAVDPRFGRAAGLLVFDTDSRELQSVDNRQNLEAAQGAGVQAAQTVAELGAEALITGHCGPKAFRVLQAAGVRIYTGATGTVEEAILALEQGRLQAAGAADVESHW